MSDHTHKCAVCGEVWECHSYPTEKKCRRSGVFKSVQVNKQGPFCNVCRTGIEFLHSAKARSFAMHEATFRLAILDRIQKLGLR